MGTVVKNLFANTSFYFMSKGLDILCKNDQEVKARLDIVPIGTKVKLGILGQKQKLVLVKKDDGFMVSKEDVFDIAITFKFFGTLPNIVFGKQSVTESYLNNEFFVQGELRYAVAIVFAIEKFMAYLMSKRKYQKVYGIMPQNSIKTGKMFGKLLFARREKK